MVQTFVQVPVALNPWCRVSLEVVDGFSELGRVSQAVELALLWLWLSHLVQSAAQRTGVDPHRVGLIAAVLNYPAMQFRCNL